MTDSPNCVVAKLQQSTPKIKDVKSCSSDFRGNSRHRCENIEGPLERSGSKVAQRGISLVEDQHGEGYTFVRVFNVSVAADISLDARLRRRNLKTRQRPQFECGEISFHQHVRVHTKLVAEYRRIVFRLILKGSMRTKPCVPLAEVALSYSAKRMKI